MFYLYFFEYHNDEQTVMCVNRSHLHVEDIPQESPKYITYLTKTKLISLPQLAKGTQHTKTSSCVLGSCDE